MADGVASEPAAAHRTGTGGSRRVVGLDGCPGGWVAVHLVDGEVDEVEVVAGAGEVLDGSPGPALIGIDIPIGLVDGPRDADVAARRLLPGRASSVFSTPPRAVVDGCTAGALATHAQATARAVSVTGAGISQQAWRLVGKIAEVDALAAAGAPVREVHPELAFALLAGGEPLPRKRSWAGVTTRRALLARLGLALPERFPGDQDAAPDDVLDAAICAWVADGEAAGETLLTVPEHTDQHDHGRAIVIHARRPPS